MTAPKVAATVGPRAELKWTAVSDAKQYLVWRRSSGGAWPGQPHATVKGLSFAEDIPAGKTVVYAVSCEDAAGNRSTRSKRVWVGRA